MGIRQVGREFGASVLRRCGDWGRILSTRMLIKISPVSVNLSSGRAILISPPLTLQSAIEEAISTHLKCISKTVEVTQVRISTVEELGIRRPEQHLRITFTGFTYTSRQNDGFFANEWHGIKLASGEVKFDKPVVAEGWYRIN